MQSIKIDASEALWRNNMLPEGILERWIVTDGEVASEGHAVAEIRFEGALHDVISPATGRLNILAPKLAVIEPGFLLATVDVGSEAGAKT